MGFFNKQTTQSYVKSEIVAQYFWRWAQAMKAALWKTPNKPFAYVDLFAGTGTYDDGSPSTPVKILERAISDPDLCGRLITFFNEGDINNHAKLKQCIESIKDVDRLKHRPVITPQEVNESAVTFFRDKWNHPTLSFVDPFGYKGVSVDLIHALISGWGCDCIVFFNYRRINMSIANKALEAPINEFLGEERAESLRKKLPTLVGPSAKRAAILEELTLAIQSAGKEIYVLPFRFLSKSGLRTLHYLIFVSKHVLGYTLMKDVMSSQGSTKEDGAPCFEYCPSPACCQLLFELSRPFEDLEAMLLRDFAGQQIRMLDVFHKHHVGKPYVKNHYKKALISLELQGKIFPQPAKRRANTMGDDVLIGFPTQ